MRKRFRYPFVGLLAALGMLASQLVAASPAHAYVNSELSFKYALVDTDNCNRIGGNLTVYAYSNGCKLYDAADNTFFKKDHDGIAIKVEIYHKGRFVAKTEFHPYGEILWVYDTRNDSDTVYVELIRSFSFKYGPYRAPGTSKVVDSFKKDFDWNEGYPIKLKIYDNSGRGDLLGTWGYGKS